LFKKNGYQSKTSVGSYLILNYLELFWVKKIKGSIFSTEYQYLTFSIVKPEEGGSIGNVLSDRDWRCVLL